MNTPDVLPDLMSFTGSGDTNAVRSNEMQKAINEHEIVIVVSNRALDSSKEIWTEVKNSNFFSNCFKYPHEYHLIVLHYNERQQNRNDLEKTLEGDFHVEDKNKENMRTRSREHILEAFRKLDRSGPESDINEECFTILNISPTLFASMELNASFRLEKKAELDRLVQFTECGELFGILNCANSASLRQGKKIISDALEELERCFMNQVRGKWETFPIDDFKKRTRGFLSMIRTQNTVQMDKFLNIVSDCIQDLTKRIEKLVERFLITNKNFLDRCSRRSKEQWRDYPSQKLSQTIEIMNRDSAFRDRTLQRRMQKLVLGPLRKKSIEFDPMIRNLDEALLELNGKVVKEIRSFITICYEQFSNDSLFKDMLNEYCKLVSFNLNDRSKRFFCFGRKSLHINQLVLDGTISWKAQESSLKKMMKEWFQDNAKDARSRNQKLLPPRTPGQAINDFEEYIDKFFQYFASELQAKVIKQITYQKEQLKKHWVAFGIPKHKKPTPKQNQSLQYALFAFPQWLEENCEPEMIKKVGISGSTTSQLSNYRKSLKEIFPSDDIQQIKENLKHETLEQIARDRVLRVLDMHFDDREGPIVNIPLRPAHDAVLNIDQFSSSLSFSVDPLEVTQMKQSLSDRAYKLWPDDGDGDEDENKQSLFLSVAHQLWGGSKKKIVEAHAYQLRQAVCLTISEQNATHDLRARFIDRYRDVIPSSFSDWHNCWKEYVELQANLSRTGDMLCLRVIFDCVLHIQVNVLVWCPGDSPFCLRSTEAHQSAYQLAVIGVDDADDSNSQFVFRSVVKLEDAALEPERGLRHVLQPSDQDKLVLMIGTSLAMNLSLHQKNFDHLEKYHGQEVSPCVPRSVREALRSISNNSRDSNRQKAKSALKHIETILDKSSFWLLGLEERYEQELNMRYALANVNKRPKHLLKLLRSRGNKVILVAESKDPLHAQCKDERLPVLEPFDKTGTGLFQIMKKSGGTGNPQLSFTSALLEQATAK